MSRLSFLNIELLLYVFDNIYVFTLDNDDIDDSVSHENTGEHAKEGKDVDLSGLPEGNLHLLTENKGLRNDDGLRSDARESKKHV
jgi:hypothetical protein